MVQFGPDQNKETLTLFSASDDNLIREWDLKTSK
jgi:WD40 repeat protein